MFKYQQTLQGEADELWQIDRESLLNDKYLVKNKLIVNHNEKNFLDELKTGLNECETFYMSVAFINFSGLQLLLDTFKELEEKGIKGKILTSTYLNFTEPKALEKIKTFSNIDLKVFVATKEVGFHTKAYIFENKKEYKIIIGSSNITQRALKSNIEWNVRVVSKKEDSFAKEVISEYVKLWERTKIVDKDFLEAYDAFIKQLNKMEKAKYIDFAQYQLIKPNEMQKRAIENIAKLRRAGEEKALVIAATGTGKTYMSAFDVMSYKPNKLLFLVHREEILQSAQKTFTALLKNQGKITGILSGNQKQMGADYLFSTVQSMTIRLEEFKVDEFEYIIIDEAHHVVSPSYQKVLAYFKPKFLLGMTATPERCDNEDIFDIFDHNVALEVRLHEALELELVIPFHYFGITDIQSIDLSDIEVDNLAELVKRLKVNQRVDFIIEKMMFYGHDGEKRKAVGFCVNREHAQYMADEFNKKGIVSSCVTGENTIEERAQVIRRLEEDENDLEVIFTVDIFNEGVDIPGINLVLMLRPTNSPVVFIQQLGRGLRKHESKTFLTVLDFIGNHNKAFLIAIALNGSRYYDKDSLKVAVANQFGDIPGCTHIQMDRIAQEQILKQLKTENFNAMKYLKEEYQAFKQMNSGRIPYLLMNYIKYDGAPDPVHFIDKEKTYLGFVQKMEKDSRLDVLLKEEIFIKVLKKISAKLPLKRPYEFVIFKYLLSHENITLKQAKLEVEKYVDHIDEQSVQHALECLNQKYDDSLQLKTEVRCFDYIDCTLSKTVQLSKLMQELNYKCYIEDVIHYGLIRYEKEFGNTNYGMPFFKLYEQYQMVDVAVLSLYCKIHSSFRGSGLITNGKEYFLFVDLHKEEDIKESINYQDKFISRMQFQWQTPNNTSQNSERGQNIIANGKRGINLHLFVRKYKVLDGKVQSYIYIGKGNTVSSNGEKPITVQLELEQTVPMHLYTEFIQKV